MLAILLGLFGLLIGIAALIAAFQGIQLPFFLTFAVLACQCAFWIKFIQVLRALGYAPVWIFGLIIVTFPPVPGLLILTALDRHIAKTLAKAEAAFRAPATNTGS